MRHIAQIAHELFFVATGVWLVLSSYSFATIALIVLLFSIMPAQSSLEGGKAFLFRCIKLLLIITILYLCLKIGPGLVNPATNTATRILSLFFTTVALVIMIVPVFLVFVFPPKETRIRRGRIQTASTTFRNEATGHQVILLGNIHVAQHSYWREIGEKLDHYTEQGYQVFTEGIKDDEAGEQKPSTWRKSVITATLDDLEYMFTATTEGLRLQFIADGIEEREGWQNCDTTVSKHADVSAKSSSFVVHCVLLRGSMKVLEFVLIEPLLNWIVRGAINVAVYYFVAFDSVAEKVGSFGDKHVVKERNNNVIEAIQLCAPSTPAVVFWGGGHMPDLAMRLINNGYHEVEREWFTAYYITAWWNPFYWLQRLRTAQ